VSCLKNNIKIYIKTAPTYFGVVTSSSSSGRALINALPDDGEKAPKTVRNMYTHTHNYVVSILRSGCVKPYHSPTRGINCTRGVSCSLWLCTCRGVPFVLAKSTHCVTRLHSVPSRSCINPCRLSNGV